MYDNRLAILFHRNYTNCSPLFYFVVRGDVMSYAIDKFVDDIHEIQRQSEWELKPDPEEYAAIFTRYLYDNFPSAIIGRIRMVTEEEGEELREEHKIANLYENGVILVDVDKMEIEMCAPTRRENEWET